MRMSNNHRITQYISVILIINLNISHYELHSNYVINYHYGSGDTLQTILKLLQCSPLASTKVNRA